MAGPNILDILMLQERKFKNCIMRDYLAFNTQYTDTTGFPFLETSSREYELQKYFEIRLEHYIRTILFNDFFRLVLESNGAGVYLSEISSDDQTPNRFLTNFEYEKIAGFEFVADFEDATVAYRYTDIEPEAAANLLSDFEDQLVILNFKNSTMPFSDRSITLPNGKIMRVCSLYDFFQERIGMDEYEDFITFLTNIVIEFQEFIGVKSVPKLSPFSLCKFRFEVEGNLKDFIQKIRDFIIADDKIAAMNDPDIARIDYGYHVIDDVNKKKEKYRDAAQRLKELLRTENILDRFEDEALYRYLIGTSDFAKSFITSEYLYKQYDCDDCFDYTAIVSGYLKSIEQLLYHIANFAKDKGYTIRPLKTTKGKRVPIDFSSENDGKFDTTLGSLFHFFQDFKKDLLLVDDTYNSAILDCLDCYRDECRNDSFHKDNNYSWSRVEFIRENTFLLYILLLTCFKLGEDERETQSNLQPIEDDRLERLYHIVVSGEKGVYEFVYMGEEFTFEILQAIHIPNESSFPSFDSFGRIKSIVLSFESVTDHEKIVITRRNVPYEMYFIDENGVKTEIQ